MRSKKAKDRHEVDRGRGFFETSSPFETFDPGGEKPKSFGGLTDHQPLKSLGGYIGGKEIMGRLDPEQYDNPRGYPGLAIVTTGTEKSKLNGTETHSIMHHMEGSANLASTSGDRRSAKKKGAD
jgi:hypothetical protein